jgi:glycosyltransferase involved in cell wall biosynthesis
MKVLVVGHCPLPWEDLERSYGPGTRTWQFAKPLLADGHKVTVLASRIPYVYPDSIEPVTRSEENGCAIYRADQTEFEAGLSKYDILEDVDPDCIVGATAYPSYVAGLIAGERPYWVDVFGSILAEGQAKAAAYDDNAFLEHYQRMNNTIVRTGDKFSTVSRRQSYELIGQLGCLARLGAETMGYEFAVSIPCGVQPIEFPPTADPTGGAAPEGSFIVLWSGGFNTWTDVDTLFEGMEIAMAGSPRVRFVSTGGSIEGHDEKTYPRFEEMVRGSEYRDRYHLLGWVTRGEAMSYYRAASVGINIDAMHYEVTFGSRNRILEWGLAGLPSISSDLCELTEEMSKDGMLFTIPVGDPRALAEMVLDLEGDRDKAADIGGRLPDYILDRYSFEKTSQPLRDWVRDPAHSPDFELVSTFRSELFTSTLEKLKPAVTADSSAAAKLAHYLKTEGAVSTARRVVPFIKRRTGPGGGE